MFWENRNPLVGSYTSIHSCIIICLNERYARRGKTLNCLCFCSLSKELRRCEGSDPSLHGILSSNPITSLHQTHFFDNFFFFFLYMREAGGIQWKRLQLHSQLPQYQMSFLGSHYGAGSEDSAQVASIVLRRLSMFLSFVLDAILCINSSLQLSCWKEALEGNEELGFSESLHGRKVTLLRPWLQNKYPTEDKTRL